MVFTLLLLKHLHCGGSTAYPTQTPGEATLLLPFDCCRVQQKPQLAPVLTNLLLHQAGKLTGSHCTVRLGQSNVWIISRSGTTEQALDKPLSMLWVFAAASSTWPTIEKWSVAPPVVILDALEPVLQLIYLIIHAVLGFC
jgi:hypothetical protein